MGEALLSACRDLRKAHRRRAAHASQAVGQHGVLHLEAVDEDGSQAGGGGVAAEGGDHDANLHDKLMA